MVALNLRAALGRAATRLVQKLCWGKKKQKLFLLLPAAKSKLRKLLADSQGAAGEGSPGRPAKLPSPHAKEAYDPAEFQELVGKYERLSWRMVSKPGGAVVKPEEFYELYACCAQAEQGDNKGERPMWAERGGLDFEGRAKWDAWELLKGTDATAAKLRFVAKYYEASPSCFYKDTR